MLDYGQKQLLTNPEIMSIIFTKQELLNFSDVRFEGLSQ